MKVELKVRADGALTPIYANLHTLIIIMFVRTVLTVTAPRMRQEYQRNHKQYFLAITVTKMLDHNNFFFRFLHRQEKTIERMLSLDENKHKDK